MYKSGHAQTIFWFVILHGMTTYKYGSRFFYLICTSCKNVSQNCRIQAVRKAYNIECHSRFATHRPDITQRIGCCDLSEHIWIIHDRCKEVYRLDHGNVVCYFINSGVIRSLYSNQQIIILEFWQLTQNLSKGLRTYLSCSTRCLTETCQLNVCFHSIISSFGGTLPAMGE